MHPAAAELVELLGLERHPEGGFFRETFRAPAAPGSGRATSTAIYFLLTAASPSTMHRIDADEVFHHYAGDPVEQLVIDADADAADAADVEVRWLGPDVVAGHRPQALVAAGAWQGCRVVEPDGWALLGCTVAPGFEFDGFELADADAMGALLATAGPAHADLLEALRP